ncbi:putative embryo defective 3006 protein [Senna tora]|uniref:Putative embryo defective 3006 protein n=1 Tax=Senna tora TaxID=362788 RepID=A0A834W4M5_9FABA|nr:putative embryo defective 3006 protein [Senna tora]
MEKKLGLAGNAPKSTGIGSRYFDLKKSFKFAPYSLLTACSKEEFDKAFPRFTAAEKDWLHRLYLQVITSLHENIEAEFESICLETQVGATLDTVEEIVEEQELDLLFSNKSNAMDVAKNLSTAKKNEIQHLMHIIQLGEEHNRMIRTQLEVLREGKQVLSGASDAIEKLLKIVIFIRQS